ncbi:hypothetical protein JCM8097_008768 [Rhodosporidiobolus ruineniae]
MVALEVDTTTIVLGSLVVLVLALKLYLRPPPPQLHPFLLGRQSTPAPTRNAGESPVYSSAANGGIRPGYRPDRGIRTLADALANSGSVVEGTSKGTWAKGGDKVAALVDALRAGLLAKLNGVEGKVLVSVSDPTDSLLVSLALATSPLKPVVLAPGSALPSGLSFTASIQSADGSLTSSDVPLDAGAKTILLGEEFKDEAYEILASGKTKTVEAAAAEPSDVALTIISEGIALDITHQNLTSSLVSWLALFPASPQQTRPTIRDFVISFHHPATPYGFGLALLILYQSASLSFLTLPAEPPATPDEITELFATKDAPPATLVFAPTKVLGQPLYTAILQQMLGDASFIVQYARNGKLRLLREGTVSKQTMWDSLLFKGIRKDLNLTRLRALVLAGPLEQSRLETFRVALGCPTLSTLEHPLLLAPLSAANMWDVQRLPPPGVKGINGREKGHVGPPGAGIEVKLRGEEGDMEAGRFRGEILVRTPTLPSPASLPASLLLADSSLPPLPAYPGKPAPAPNEALKWLRTGVRAEMAPEGVLWLVEEK